MLDRLVRTSLIAIVATVALGASAGAANADTPAGGKADQQFTDLSGSITGTKPESKLWYDHDAWWAVMAHGSQLSIWRLDRGTETWVDTNTIVEARTGGDYRADTLVDADGSLTISTHLFT